MMTIARFLLLATVLFCACAAVSSAQSTDDLVRNVTGGRIRGRVGTVYSSIALWLNVPFADTNNTRFLPAKPLPAMAWPGIREAVDFGPGCTQLCDFPNSKLTCPQQITEDGCLNLNVFAPLSVQSSSSKPLPVLIFTPGGAFEQGAGGVPMYNGESFAATQNAVVVTINYRVEAFGMLLSPTPGSKITGNQLIKDQRMALQWVNSNIRRFGGDPKRVTLSGESAGAISTLIHTLVSPKSRPGEYFQAAIASSNPLGLPLPTRSQSLELGKKFIKDVGCDGLSADAELACLQAKPVQTLLNVSRSTRVIQLTKILNVLLPWQPFVDGDEVVNQQIDAAISGTSTIQQGNQSSTFPILFHNNFQDVFLFVAELSPSKPISQFEADIMLGYIFGASHAFKIKKIFGHGSNSSDARFLLSEIMTAYLMTCPARRTLQSLKGNNVYAAVFDVLPSVYNWIWGNLPGLNGPQAYKDCGEFAQICHATDLAFIFNGTQFYKSAPAMSGADFVTVRQLQNAWGGMVGNGSPGVSDWEPISGTQGATDGRYFFRAPGSGVVKGYQQEACNFFDSIGYSRDGVFEKMKNALQAHRRSE